MSLPPIFPVVLSALVMALLPEARGAGELDNGFNPNVTGYVYSTMVQPDGKVIIGGSISAVGGVARSKVARLNANGTLDGGFNPTIDANVTSIAPLQSGKMLIAGEFSQINGVSRKLVARLNSDGTLDTGFNANVDGITPSISCTLVQPSGKVIIGGNFTTLNGVTRNNIARVNEDGSLDASFNPNVSGTVNSLAAQADGKILIAGNISSVNGAARADLARLNADGTLDTDFNVSIGSAFVSSVAVQGDGKILIGGLFSTVGGVSRTHVARIDPDGAVDMGFNPYVNNGVHTLALQADGKIIMGGDFSVVNTVTRNYLARLNPDGTTDSNFAQSPSSSVYGTALQADGKILVAGAFISVGGTSRNRVARLDNDAASQSLVAQDPTHIEWQRGGSAPEGQDVAFELSTDGGGVWSHLGFGTRTASGWQLTGTTLLAGSKIRARARTTGGYTNGSSGLVEAVALVDGFSVPEISVEQPTFTAVPDGGSRDFGAALVGSERSLTFTIRNLGNADLTGVGIIFVGPNASDFTVSSNPASSVPSASATSFTVRFAPTTGGTKSATLRLASNDLDENPFDINITGRALASSADEDGDGISNGTEMALAPLGFDPFTDSSALRALVQANASGLGIPGGTNEEFLALGSPVLEKNATTGKFHLILRLEKSSNLSNWSPVSGFLPTYDIPSGKIDIEITPAGSNTQFYRVFGAKP